VIEVSSYILQFYIIDQLRFLMVINYDFMWRQVPGVEADDVIGTLAVNSVKDGFKVIIWALFLKYLRVYNEI
jgi:5'-3' exonuclease